MPFHPTAPLLREPAPPFLESQVALAQGAGDLAELAQWRYRLRYRAEHMAQDVVIVTVAFNVPPGGDASASAAPPRADDQYRVQLEYGDDGEQLRALRLVRERRVPAPAIQWPEVAFRASADAVVDLGQGEGDDTTRTYVIDPRLLPPQWPGVELTWSRLATSALQSARASLAVVRNGDAGLTGAGEHIFRSATVDAASAAVPLVRWTQDIPIRDLGDALGIALDASFARLFGEHHIGRRVTVQLSYGHRLMPVDAGDALMSYQPVTMYPVGAITATLASELAAAAAAWQGAYGPGAQGDEWLIALAQFSEIDVQAAQPLLDIDRLTYPV